MSGSAPAAPEARLERHPDALHRWLLDGVLVAGPRSDEPLHLTTPGDAVWAVMAEPRTPATVAALLGKVFGVPAPVVRTDIAPVLDALLAVGALRAVH
jgi:hypothetical protein